MLSPATIKAAFEAGLPYDKYIASGRPDQLESWRRAAGLAREHAGLDSHQRASLADFSRQVNILVISGLWCGDCVAQCPLLDIIADGKPDLIRVRFVDRDAHASLAEQVRICGGMRVPTAIFANEDFEFVSLYGDKSLARLRALAANSLGAMCPLPTADVPPDETKATLQDWLSEVERVHLLLRLSPKLRSRHGD